MEGLGRVLLVLALVLAVFGVLFTLAGRGVLPRLPGDISIGRGSTRIFIPLGTSILVSIVLTIVVNLFLRR
jgi:hypothetical protein